MLHERAGAGALGVVRVVVFGLWLVIVAFSPLRELAELPGSLLRPVGIMALLPAGFWDAFIAPAPLTAFRIALSLLLLAVVAGVRPRQPFMILAVLGLVLFDGTLKSFGGFVNHSRFALLYVAILFSLVPSAPESRNGLDPGSVLRLAALLMAIAYALIGSHRILVGGAAIFLDDSLATYIMLRTFEPARYTFEFGYLAVGSAAALGLVKAGFLVTTAAEVASPFVVFHRRLRWVWLLVIVPFHLATLVTMNIFFWENLVLLAVLFTDLPTRADRWLSRRGWPVRPWRRRGPAPGPPPSTRRPPPARAASPEPGPRGPAPGPDHP